MLREVGMFKGSVDDLLRDSLINFAIDNGNSQMLESISNGTHTIVGTHSGMDIVKEKEHKESVKRWEPISKLESNYISYENTNDVECERCCRGKKKHSINVVFDDWLHAYLCDHCYNILSSEEDGGHY